MSNLKIVKTYQLVEELSKRKDLVQNFFINPDENLTIQIKNENGTLIKHQIFSGVLSLLLIED